MLRRNSFAFFLYYFCIFIFCPSQLLAEGFNFLDTPNGSDSAFLASAPWSGYWWQKKGGYMFKGWDEHPESPLFKYDKYVEQKTGQNPGSCDWEGNRENKHYLPHNAGWEGHCNGWSAASILEPEPTASRTVDGITFTVGDQKALLSEMYMDCYCEFYGQRSEDPDYASPDIYPNIFHRLLVENIKTKHRAIVADIDPRKPVWNYPITGYETSWESSANKSRVYFTTKVYYIDDNVPAEYVGIKWFAKTYYYTLFLNEKGEVTGGNWTKSSVYSHPDFVWIPTADAPADRLENPKLDTKFVHEITGHPIPVPPAPSSPASAPNRLECDKALFVEAGVDLNEYLN
ncbi:MAG: hypothetical protein HQM08_01855 [Candidatus Riflebacteria bacterium]|nr:hypothetical protein [Candidatus Riflebacteria bacterium]